MEHHDSDAQSGIDAAPSGERQRSTIAFPYANLKEALNVARAVYENVGSGMCEDAQLAAWLGMSSKSSGFRVRLSAARLFGVIESPGGGQHTLTDLGIEVVDPDRQEVALVTAFLKVPLFSKIFEQWNGRQLPPSAGLEREMVGLGVAEKQKDKARQVFSSSADLAGFFRHGRDKLVRPAIKADQENAAAADQAEDETNDVASQVDPGLDPVIKGLIDKLPVPGDVWPISERKLWLQLLEGSFQLVYEDVEDQEEKGVKADDIFD